MPLRKYSVPIFNSEEELLQYYALHFRWEREKLAAVLSQFGQLTLVGKGKLIRHLVRAFGEFQSLGVNVRTITPNAQHEQLRAVEKAAARFLDQLGVNVKNVPPQEMWKLLAHRMSASIFQTLSKQRDEGVVTLMRLASAGIDKNDTEPASSNAQLNSNSDRLIETLVNVLWIYERAGVAAEAIAPRPPQGHGGARNPVHQKGALIRCAIETYARMRTLYPDSGPVTGFGGPLHRFVQAVGALFGAAVTEKQIEDVWRRRDRISNPK